MVDFQVGKTLILFHYKNLIFKQFKDNKLVTNWKTLKLGDVLTLKRGYDLPKQDRIEGAVPIYSSSGLSGYHNEVKVKGPGVVTGRYGTLGEVFYTEEDYWPHNTTLYVKDFKGNHPKFIFYFIQTLSFNDKNDKTSVPGLNRNHLHELQVAIPEDLPTQRRIAEILSALDDKIELNRRMNQTLEQMAQTLFRQYFVDGIDEENLPEGWRVGTVREICNVNSSTLSKQDKLDWLDYVEISAVGKGVINSIANYKRGEEPSRARRKLTHGDTVLSTVRPDRGAYFLAINPYKNLIASTGFAVFTAIEVPYSFLYLLLTQEENFKYYGFIANGAAYPAINPESILAIETVIPSEESLAEFHAKVVPLLLKYNSNNLEAKSLSSLRDTLLPKLMSGEIDVMQTQAHEQHEPVLS